MAKKKPPTKGKAAAIAGLEKEHDEFKAAVATAEADHAFWFRVTEDSRLKAMLDEFRDDIEEHKELLTDPKMSGDATKQSRAIIEARRAILKRFTTVLIVQAVTDAKRDLARFRDQNQIFLAQGK